MEGTNNHDSSSSALSGLKKGSWTKEEDALLKNCVEQFGEGKWHAVPRRAGLNRCRKSCRLRWLNYLKPDIKKGSFDGAEVDLMKRLHALLGNRWTLIAGRLPGRTANDVKNFWNAHIEKKSSSSSSSPSAAEAMKKLQDSHTFLSKTITKSNIIRPQPLNLCKIRRDSEIKSKLGVDKSGQQPSSDDEHVIKWWNDLLEVADSKDGSEASLLSIGEHEIDPVKENDINEDLRNLVDDGYISLDIEENRNAGGMKGLLLDMNLWDFSGFYDDV